MAISSWSKSTDEYKAFEANKVRKSMDRKTSYVPPKGSDFQVLSTVKPKAVVLIFGDGASGKTSFPARFAPDPVLIISLDRRAEPAVIASNKLGRRVGLAKVELPAGKMDPDRAKAEALKCVDKVIRNMEIALADSLRGGCRTICLDTATEYAEILKISFDGVVGQTKAGAYGKDKDYINRQFWRLFQMARDGDAHFVLTSRAKEIWRKDESGQQVATGEYTYRCPGVCNDAVDLAMHIKIDGVTRKPGKRPDPKFQLKVTKAGINVEEYGAIYKSSDWDDFGGPFVYSCWQQYMTLGIPLKSWQS